MELLEDPLFKSKYQKYKRRVKIWESNFMEKYGRKPNKNDIKEADTITKEAYKMYWKLKTRALEETLMDITFTDDTQTNISTDSPIHSDAKKIEEKSLINIDQTGSENIDPCNLNVQETTDCLIDEPDVKNLKDVWSDNVCKSKEPKKSQNVMARRSSSFQLSQNKFTTSGLTKRNPRKSLSTKIKSDVKKDQSANKPDIPVQADDKDMDENTKAIFGDPVKIVITESKDSGRSLNTIHQLMENQIITVNRNVNQGWLDRCVEREKLDNTMSISQRLSNLNDSGTESMESSSPKDAAKLMNDKLLPVSDDEDFICNSDTEEDHKSKRVRNSKKRLNDFDHVAKRPCIETNSILSNTPLYINNNETSVLKVCDTEVNQTSIGLTLQDDKKDEDVNINSKSEITNDKPSGEINCSSVQNNISLNKEDKEDTKTAKEKKPRGRNQKTRKKKNPTNNENSDEIKPKKPTRRKQVKKDKENHDDPLSDMENFNEPVFGIETLEAVPRIAICSSGTGDLVTDFSNSVSSLDPVTCTAPASNNLKRTATNKEKLEQKIASGSLNENFVRINIKKKVFVRGKKTFNFSKYKKNQWKQKKKSLGASEQSLDVIDYCEQKGTSCFKCGNTGHFSRYCTVLKQGDLLPLTETDELAQYPSLEEAEKMANQNAIIAHSRQINRLPENPLYISNKGVQEENLQSMSQEDEYILDDDDFAEMMEEVEKEKEIFEGHKIPDELLARLVLPEFKGLSPLYMPKEDQSLIETPQEVFEVLHMFGHESFRPGQEKAIMRILSGQSTLLTLSTGSGKSLCYQLPAYLYSKYSTCITLVISPLVSLMDDQVTGMPSFISAACLHTNQTPKVRDNIMQLIKQSKVQILLVSPEAVVAGEKSTGFGALLRELPPIAFACIDEAHCISQWSHNFRPSYLLVSRVLKEKLGVKTVLALTATATKSTAESIVNHLDIHDGMRGVISDIPLPDNLLLTVSKDDHRDNALVKLLLSERYEECNSIIIYCTRREECVRIASFLRVSLQKNMQQPEKVNNKVSCIAEAYHAGLSAYRRKMVQKAFMNGQIRIVVATVAFGMGINKSDIRSVIHYNMPGTFEGYVQEVGRAGRDGLSAQCHLFLNPGENNDKWELRRHIYANSVDRHTIRRLLAKVFIPCSCAQINGTARKCSGHEVGLPLNEIVEALDITEEMIMTLLCYLELHHKRFLTVLSSAYTMARITSYNGPQALKLAAQSCPPLAMAIALDLKKGISHENSNIIEFPVINVASIIGWDSGVVKKHLKDLEWKTVNGKPKRSAISVRYDTLGLRVKARGDLTDVELDEALELLVSRTQSQETSSLQQLELITSTLNKYSMSTINQCLVVSEEMTNNSKELKNVIRSYFQLDRSLNNSTCKLQVKLANEEQIAADVRSLVLSYKDSNFTGRAVARIFHGIQSPNYPAVVWGKCRFWRMHISSDFNAICYIATKEILALR
ncbi:hypothetical protein KPH14_011449 [Odynerus spinipes]|uniref:DNA 3'-5' helicase n=1 Tax=Odynerus spinipes TaxID=1348599 RepID=A0AAD9VUJ4_9HYME|nr:hypothetical protein KPH14_011449 [Odynerus spinipes]